MDLLCFYRFGTNLREQVLTIGDCTKYETQTFFRERIVPRVPERLRAGLDFAELWEAFGGKLAHWNDFVTDYSVYSVTVCTTWI